MMRRMGERLNAKSIVGNSAIILHSQIHIERSNNLVLAVLYSVCPFRGANDDQSLQTFGLHFP